MKWVYSAYFSHPNSHFVTDFIASGALGVQLFFIISALTLCWSYSKSLTVDSHPTIKFFLRRFFRLAPLNYLATIFYYFAFNSTNRLWQPGIVITTANLISNFFFAHGLSPYWINSLVIGGWSITVEFTFYLFFPLLFHYINTLQKALWATLFMAIFSQTYFLILYRFSPIPDCLLWNNFLYYSFPNQLSIFLLGFIIYFLLKDKINILKYHKFILFFTTCFIINLVTKNLLSEHFIFSLFFSLIILLFAFHPYKLFVNKFTIYLGKISFSLYLVHFVLYHYLTSFFLVFVASIIIGTITYYLIELSGQKLGLYFIALLKVSRKANSSPVRPHISH